MTVGDEGRAHLLAVLPELADDAITSGASASTRSPTWRRTRRRRSSGLPPRPDGFSLIVDGTAATGNLDGEIVVTPTKAILHRPAVDAEGKRTGSDCAPV